MATGEVVVYLFLGAMTQDWCDTCLTSSRVVFDVYGWTDRLGPSSEPLATVDGCLTCDPNLVSDTAEAVGDVFTEVASGE